MKKQRLFRLVALLIVMAFVSQSLIACSVSIGHKDEMGWQPILVERNPYEGLYKITVGDPTLVYQWSPENDEAVFAQIDLVNRLIEEGTDADAFFEGYTVLDEMFSHILDQYQMAYIEFNLLGDNQESIDNYLYINELYETFRQKVVAMYATIYESPFSEEFYEDWTEEEIREALDMAALFTEEFADMNALSDELTVEYRTYDIYSEKEEIRDLYARFVKNNHDIAVQLGYENYMEYAYQSVYGRDYTREDVDTMTAYLREYLAPLLIDAIIAWQTNYQTLSPEDAEQFETLIMGINFDSKAGKALSESYFTALSSSAHREYTKFWKNGNYFISDDKNSYSGAFTWKLYGPDKPIMYFGPDYQNMFTFIHEFGHYMSDVFGEELNSMDLKETQSQSDEMLFLRYLESCEEYSEAAVKCAAQYQTWNAIFNILQQCVIDRFEWSVYEQAETVTADDFDDLYHQAIMDVFGDETLQAEKGQPKTGYDLFAWYYDDPDIYWYAVTVESPGYYISYATSMIASLEMYALSGEDFAVASQNYMKLLKADTDYFCDELAEAGLYTPFEEDAYQMIAEVINALIAE